MVRKEARVRKGRQQLWGREWNGKVEGEGGNEDYLILGNPKP